MQPSLVATLTSAANRVEVERVGFTAAVDIVHAAGVVDIGVLDVARREAVGAAWFSGNATLEHGGGRVEVDRSSDGAPVDGEGAAAVIRVCSRQKVGCTGVVVRTGPVVGRLRVPAEGATDVVQLPAAEGNGNVVAEDLNVKGGPRVCSHAAWDAARSIILDVEWVVERRAEAVVECGRRVIIKTHAVSAPTVGAIATGGVGAFVEVKSGRIEAAGHDADALPGQRGRGVVIECGRVGASL
eukprot:scaffold35908_cov54-Phaeocystis_antarctica.AAC.1